MMRRMKTPEQTHPVKSIMPHPGGQLPNQISIYPAIPLAVDNK